MGLILAELSDDILLSFGEKKYISILYFHIYSDNSLQSITLLLILDVVSIGNGNIKSSSRSLYDFQK